MGPLKIFRVYQADTGRQLPFGQNNKQENTEDYESSK
jgi:hypothetical protein